MATSHKNWIKLTDRYPKEDEIVEIQDDVGKLGRASYLGRKCPIGWNLVGNMSFRDFGTITKWRAL